MVVGQIVAAGAAVAGLGGRVYRPVGVTLLLAQIVDGLRHGVGRVFLAGVDADCRAFAHDVQGVALVVSGGVAALIHAVLAESGLHIVFAVVVEAGFTQLFDEARVVVAGDGVRVCRPLGQIVLNVEVGFLGEVAARPVVYLSGGLRGPARRIVVDLHGERGADADS